MVPQGGWTPGEDSSELCPFQLCLATGLSTGMCPWEQATLGWDRGQALRDVTIRADDMWSQSETLAS